MTSSRTGDKTTGLGAKHHRLGVAFGQPDTIAVNYEVLSNGYTDDAFNIAEACMDDWTTYLRSKDLIT